MIYQSDNSIDLNSINQENSNGDQSHYHYLYQPEPYQSAAVINQTTFSNGDLSPTTTASSAMMLMEQTTTANFPNLTLPYWYDIPFLLNISRDVPDEFGVVLFGYILPVLLLLTIVTNLMIVVVLSKAHMRTPTNLVLLTMAVADLLTLLLPAPWYFYLYTLGNHQQALYPPNKCYLFHCMYEVLPALFHTYSIWLTLLLAGQRYVYVCHFSMARTWCTVPRVTRTIISILLIAILHQMTRFFDRTFLGIKFIWNDQVIEGCEYFTSNWVHIYIGEDIYYLFYYGFRIIFVHIGPCFILVLLNVLLFRALRQTQATRERLFAASYSLASSSVALASKSENHHHNHHHNHNQQIQLFHQRRHNRHNHRKRSTISTSVVVNDSTNLDDSEMVGSGRERRRVSLSGIGVGSGNRSNGSGETANNQETTNTANNIIRSLSVIDGDSQEPSESSAHSPKVLTTPTSNNNSNYDCSSNNEDIFPDINHLVQNANISTNSPYSVLATSKTTTTTVVTGSSTSTSAAVLGGGPTTATNSCNNVMPLASATVTSGSTPSIRRADSNSTTIMLIVIVSVFLLLEIPLTVTTILHVVQNTFTINLVEYNTLNTIILITNFFIILSYPINFAIYCGMSRQFRQTFAQLFVYRTMQWCESGNKLLQRIQQSGRLQKQPEPGREGGGVEEGPISCANVTITNASYSTFSVTNNNNILYNRTETPPLDSRPVTPTVGQPIQLQLQQSKQSTDLSGLIELFNNKQVLETDL